jgi:outer membrane protein assembly factor BamD (BamD/ComL family)
MTAPLMRNTVRHPLERLMVLALLATLTTGCAGSGGLFGDLAKPSQAKLKDAQFVKGKGYWIESTGQFVDSEGNPIESPAAGGEQLVDNGADVVPSEGSDEEELTRLRAYDEAPSMATRVMRSVDKMTGRGPNRPVANEALQEGYAAFEQRDYVTASKRFKKAAQRWPDSDLEEEAMFMAAESLFFADRYAQADDMYGRLLEKYDNTSYLDRVTRREFAIALYWEELQKTKPLPTLAPNLVNRARPRFDTLGHSLKTYERIWLKDPTGPLADDALLATANSYFIRGRYVDADEYYDMLRKNHPRSEHQFSAHVLGVRSKLATYQGPEYNAEPLEEADRLAKRTMMQFSDQMGDERERMVKLTATAAALDTQRDWARAEYNDRTKKYRAARQYYQRIVDEHPETKYAQLARERLGEIADEPDVGPTVAERIQSALPFGNGGTVTR